MVGDQRQPLHLARAGRACSRSISRARLSARRGAGNSWSLVPGSANTRLRQAYRRRQSGDRELLAQQRAQPVGVAARVGEPDRQQRVGAPLASAAPVVLGVHGELAHRAVARRQPSGEPVEQAPRGEQQRLGVLDLRQQFDARLEALGGLEPAARLGLAPERAVDLVEQRAPATAREAGAWQCEQVVDAPRVVASRVSRCGRLREQGCRSRTAAAGLVGVQAVAMAREQPGRGGWAPCRSARRSRARNPGAAARAARRITGSAGSAPPAAGRRGERVVELAERQVGLQADGGRELRCPGGELIVACSLASSRSHSRSAARVPARRRVSCRERAQRGRRRRRRDAQPITDRQARASSPGPPARSRRRRARADRRTGRTTMALERTGTIVANTP